MDASNRVFIGNLSFGATEEVVRDHFKDVGNLTDVYIPFKKGFGFVTFSTAEEAQKAVSELDGSEVDGRPIHLDFARPKAPRE
ncbi:MAG: RNA-binding protein [Patescibacteria group bacterium]